MESQEKIKYIYVLSQRYSGSTLISFLLATHPQIATIGERRKFYNKVLKSEDFQHHKAKLCSCGLLFEECDYFNQIKKNLLHNTDGYIPKTNATEFYSFKNKHANAKVFSLIKWSVLKGNRVHDLVIKYKINAHLRFNEQLVNSILSQRNKTIFLDTSKVMHHALLLSRSKQFEFYVIWLVRDPRAQVNSSLKYNSFGVEQAAENWCREMKENEQILRVANMNYLKIRYEEFCRTPLSTLENIAKFVHIKNDFSIKFREIEQHIIGNKKMRLGNDQKIEERQEWRSQLSADQIEKINHITKDYSTYYANQTNIKSK